MLPMSIYTRGNIINGKTELTVTLPVLFLKVTRQATFTMGI